MIIEIHRGENFFSLGTFWLLFMSIITLITDFGSKDYYVALLKGQLLQAIPQATLVDITHEITPHDIMEGAFFLRSTYRRFPKGTIHIVGVNTFYEPNSRLIVFEHEEYFFIGPNNGLFSLVLNDVDESVMIEIADQDELDLYQVIGNAVQGISVGSPLKLLGEPLLSFERKLSLQPVVNNDQIRATILHVDHFGNVIVNLTHQTFERIRKGRNFMIFYKSDDPIVRLSRGYNDVQIGDVCAFFNSIQMLELAVHMGNAHELLSLNKNETIQIDFF